MHIVKFLALFLAISIIYAQTVPEAASMTGFPDQNQDAYQGWILTDNQTESYLYYQLFSAEGTSFNSSSQDSSQIPLVLYLEGGPGDSSTMTLYADFGPYGINSNINFTGAPNNVSNIQFSLYKRNVTWSTYVHILSVDSPVFTGFSFSKTGALLNNTVDVGIQLISFLTRFYQLYPQLIESPLFIAGHSYGGHWVPYLAYSLLHDCNLTLAGNKIDLSGVVLLNPLVSTGLQIGESDYFYSAGVTDTNKRDLLKGLDFDIRYFVQLGQWVNASYAFTDLQGFAANAVPGYLVTTNVTLDNIRRNRLPNNQNSLELVIHAEATQLYLNFSIPTIPSGRDFFNIPEGVNFLEGYCTAEFQISGDIAVDYAYAVEYLLDQGIDVVFLGAQDDGTIPLPTVVNLVSSLNWPQANNFKNAQRNIWYDENNNVVGNYKKFENLNIVTLYNSGHDITMDQPEVMVLFTKLTTSYSWK